MTKNKPEKPDADFPLFAHASGQWAKKINGKMKYFGHWDNPTAALAKYRETLTAIPETTPAPGVARHPLHPRIAAAKKAAKPSASDSPLYLHSNGQWSKKIRTVTHYFGSDYDLALAKYLQEKDDLQAGRIPGSRLSEDVTLDELCNRFLKAKALAVQAGDLDARTYNDYRQISKKLLALLGRNTVADELTPIAFEKFRAKLAVGLTAVTLKNQINKMKVIFNYGVESKLLSHPMEYGQGFSAPRAKTIRRERREKGTKLFTAKQILDVAVLAQSEQRYDMWAMALLGINCGFGNNDCATLEFSHLDLDLGFHCKHRSKTEVDRRCPLWPETIAAIKASIEHRREHKSESDSQLVFITRCGLAWNHDSTAITLEFTKLLERTGAKRPGLNFYGLRHTFQTIGEESRDPAAVQFVMGHTPRSDDMSAVYREQITDERLRAVTDCVRAWMGYGVKKRKSA